MRRNRSNNCIITHNVKKVMKKRNIATSLCVLNKFQKIKNSKQLSKIIHKNGFMTRPRGYKTFFKLNSVEHEILNAHKDKNIEKFCFF